MKELIMYESNSENMYASIAKSHKKIIDSPPIGISYMNMGQHYSDKLNNLKPSTHYNHPQTYNLIDL